MFFSCMSSNVNVLKGICLTTKLQCKHASSASSGRWARKDFKSAKATLKASLVAIDKHNNSCGVILVSIFASWARILNWNDEFCFLVASFRRAWLYLSSFCFPLSEGYLDDLLLASYDDLEGPTSAFSKFLRYGLPNLVPGRDAASCSTTTVIVSILESVSWVLSSGSFSIIDSIALHVWCLPLALDFFLDTTVVYCSSLRRFGCTQKISCCSVAKGVSPFFYRPWA